MFYEITADCAGCAMCAKRCPARAISGERRTPHHIDPSECKECGTCWRTCPKAAVLDPRGRRRAGKPPKELPRAVIDVVGCAGCRNCLLNCPFDAITFQPWGIGGRILGRGHCVIDPQRCHGCTACVSVCPTGAVSVTVEPAAAARRAAAAPVAAAAPGRRGR